MRALLILPIFLIQFSSNLYSQTWKSIYQTDSYTYTPWEQFAINPYTNDIWLLSSYDVSVIESDGSVHVFGDNELGWVDLQLETRFTFTSLHTYMCRANGWGLYTVDNYIPQLKYTFNDYSGELGVNGDTVLIIKADLGGYHRLVKHTDNGTFISPHAAPRLVSKGIFTYADIGSNSNIVYFPQSNSGSYISIQSDPDYLGGTFNDWKFSRFTDTLFVAGKEGISLAFNYDFIDTITPNNTSGMLSSNVLEIEFDHEDKLWAIFGDINDNPIGIAKLDGVNWIDYTTNCPLDFGYFLGMEIDSYGNVWLADGDAIHTLLGPNSPGWLNLNENESTFNVYPNPVQDELSIQTDSFDFARIIDMHGKEIGTYKSSVISTSNLDAGIYMLHVYSLDGKMTAQRIVKQ